MLDFGICPVHFPQGLADLADRRVGRTASMMYGMVFAEEISPRDSPSAPVRRPSSALPDAAALPHSSGARARLSVSLSAAAQRSRQCRESAERLLRSQTRSAPTMTFSFASIARWNW